MTDTGRVALVKTDYSGNIIWTAGIGLSPLKASAAYTQQEIGVDPDDGSVYISAQFRNTQGEFSISGTNYNLKVLADGSGLALWLSRCNPMHSNGL